MCKDQNLEVKRTSQTCENETVYLLAKCDVCKSGGCCALKKSSKIVNNKNNKKQSSQNTFWHNYGFRSAKI